MNQHYPTTINLPTGLEMLLSGENDHRSECPTCCQQTLLRKVTLTRRSVLPMLRMIQNGGTATSKQIHDWCGRTAYANFTQLKYWNFIQEVDGATWSVTGNGTLFAKDAICTPECLWVYNDHPRNVPDYLRGRMVYLKDLPNLKEMSREIAATESIRLDANGQTLL